ncbi:protein of unknown function [Algoriphagus faecimaris]|uniref:DUF4136 domain-containing protein n=1 Tax=Algoriphagus faecimaris TaxID=686796 RepID=A0A1G6T498_9BACT|nr:DUF4136 domain-containing protein [Algoriphagus faecimaris]SDD23849.1 protein of unknown function [Algoriphagus faecimaris]
MRRIIAFISLVLISSCSAIEIFKENTEIRPNSSYGTFVIVNEEVGMSGFSDPALDELVQKEIRTLLEGQGMIYEKRTPDLVIRYTSNEDLRQREMVNNNPFPMWGYRVWDPWLYNPYMMNNNLNRSRTREYELLQVILDFIDPEKDKFLMTLTGVTEVGNPKTKKRKVVKSTEKILERFILELNATSNTP